MRRLSFSDIKNLIINKAIETKLGDIATGLDK